MWPSATSLASIFMLCVQGLAAGCWMASEVCAARWGMYRACRFMFSVGIVAAAPVLSAGFDLPNASQFASPGEWRTTGVYFEGGLFAGALWAWDEATASLALMPIVPIILCLRVASAWTDWHCFYVTLIRHYL